MNVSGIVYVIGSGMAMCMRTMTALKLGQGRMAEAKKIGQMCWCLTLMYSLCIGITLMSIPEKISTIYTNLESVKETLVPMIFWGGLCAIMLGMGACVATLLRVVGKSCFLSVLMGVDQVLIFDGLSALFLYGWGWPAYTVVFAFMTGYTISIVVGSLVIFLFNWERIPKIDK